MEAKKKMKKGKIIGLSIGGVFLTLIIVLAIIIIVTLFSKDPNKIITTDIQVTKVEFTLNNDNIKGLEIGEKIKLEYKVYPANAKNKSVTFKSEDESVATVSETGIVEGISSGQTIIVIETVDGGFKDSFTIVVKEKVVEIDYTNDINESISRFEATSGDFNIDLSKPIELETSDVLIIEYNNVVKDAMYNWTSSDNSIVKLEEKDGKIELTVLSTGSVTITLTVLGPNDEIVVKKYDVSVIEKYVAPKILSVKTTGLKSEYYQYDTIDTSNVSFIIEYNNNTNKIIKLTDLQDFPTLSNDIVSNIIEDNRETKEYKYPFIDEYNNSCEFIITYKIIELLVTSFKVNGVEDKYSINEQIEINLITVTYNSMKTEYLDISLLSSNNISSLDMTTSGVKHIELKYKNYVYTKDIEVFEELYRVKGLNNSYTINEIIDYNNIYLEKVYKGEVTKYYVKDIYNVDYIYSILDTTVLGNFNFDFVYDDIVYTSNVVSILDRVVKTIDSYSCSELKNEYYINEIIDADLLNFTFVFGPEDSITLAYQDALPYIVSLDFDTTTVGKKTIILKYEEQDCIFEYNVKYYDIYQVSLIDFPKYFYVDDRITLGSIKVVCNNNMFTETLSKNNARVSIEEVKTNTIGSFKSVITLDLDYLEEPYTYTYNYEVVNPLSISQSEMISISNTFEFMVNMNTIYRKNDLYQLIIPDSNDYTISSVAKNDNGNFKVTLILHASSSIVECRLKETNCSVNIKLQKVRLSDNSITISMQHSNQYFLVGSKITCIINIDYNGVRLTENEYSLMNFSWSGCDVITQSDTMSNVVSCVGNTGKTYSIKCTITFNNEFKNVYGILNYSDNPYYGINFSMGNKKYGIGEEYVLAGLYIRNPLYNQIPVAKTYTFDAICIDTSAIDINKLVWYTNNPNIAEFDNNGVLRIYSSGEVTLFVTTKEAINLGYVGENQIGKYIGKWTIKCISDALLIDDSNQLDFAFNNDYPVVLNSNVYVGPNVLNIEYDETTGVTSRTLNPNINNHKALIVNRLDKNFFSTTWEPDFLINNNLETKVYYGIEVTTDVFGNGYTLDCSQFTTYQSVVGDALTGFKYFNGPLDFIQLLTVCRVYGQDDIGFVIRDNVTIDNVILQNCDSGYLQVNGKIDYNKLNNVGTVCEVMGDNVTIKNSRIRNGRNVIRIYGSENPDEVIHTTIESCIISNAREFLVKIGTNKELTSKTSVMYNNELTYICDLYEKKNMNMADVSKNIVYGTEGNYNLLFNTSSPYLKKADNTNYEPRNDNNILDEYFLSNYVKTFVTIKNSVLLSTSFFAIALESKFSGPILGGYKFAPKHMDLELFNFSYKGIKNMNGTSYAASLCLEGDVRIYNWKNLVDYDSSTIVEEMGNASRLLGLVGEDTKFEFNIAEIISNISITNPNITDSIDGKTYAHGGIVFYGGGKNYHTINLDNYCGYEFTEYKISMSELGQSIFVRCIPWVAGQEPFRFFMYDNSSELNYKTQEQLLNSDQAYNNVVKAE